MHDKLSRMCVCSECKAICPGYNHISLRARQTVVYILPGIYRTNALITDHANMAQNKNAEGLYNGNLSIIEL
jgi:hypothetical protein